MKPSSDIKYKTLKELIGDKNSTMIVSDNISIHLIKQTSSNIIDVIVKINGYYAHKIEVRYSVPGIYRLVDILNRITLILYQHIEIVESEFGAILEDNNEQCAEDNEDG